MGMRESIITTEDLTRISKSKQNDWQAGMPVSVEVS